MSNRETTFVRCASNNPVVVISHNIALSTLVEEHSGVIRHSESWEHRLPNGDLIQLDLVVLDTDTTDSLENVLSIGGESPGLDCMRIGTPQYTLGVGVPELEQLELRELDMFTKNKDVGQERPSPRQRQSDRDELAKTKAKELINKHLDDIISQANILKETEDALVRSDAYSRMHFAMSRIDRIEAGLYSNHRGRVRGRDVDIVYNSEDDSYYTPDGRFLETKDQRSARAWYGDASPASMECLRRDVARGELARELTEEHNGAIHRREQFWNRNDSRVRPSEERYMRERSRRSRDEE